MASNSKTSTTNFPSMWLNLIIDVKANKVVFAEADQDFVDFIFDLMTWPLASLSKHFNSQDDTVASCNVGALYQSIHDLHTDCFPSLCYTKDSLLSPKTATTICPNCNWTMKSTEYVIPTTSKMLKFKNNAKYVNSGAAYMVTDKMEVRPMSVSFVLSLFEDLENLKQKHVEVGLLESVAIIKAIMENRDVFTSVFLQEKVKEKATK